MTHDPDRDDRLASAMPSGADPSPTPEEAWAVSEAMIEFGGSFVHFLGQTLRRADPMNVRVIRAAWPGYWREYLNLHRAKERYLNATDDERDGEERDDGEG